MALQLIVMTGSEALAKYTGRVPSLVFSEKPLAEPFSVQS